MVKELSKETTIAEERAPSVASLAVELSAVLVTASPEEPKVLTLRGKGEERCLPSGPLEPQHPTLEAGLRAWVEARTHQSLGHIEQLCTFGDLDRRQALSGRRLLSVSYLALAREAPPAGQDGAAWSGWYRFLPWEDWRAGRPPLLVRLEPALQAWAAAGGEQRAERERRLRLAFPAEGAPWPDERTLERYELLYEARLLPEAWRGARPPAGVLLAEGESLAANHRRILATAIGRLRGQIRHRPLVFELMPPSFTFLQLQRTVEALAGLRLHKPNFRRLVEHQGLVEETGEITSETGGRPARLLRFRPEVMLERRAPGLRLPSGRRRASG